MSQSESMQSETPPNFAHFGGLVSLYEALTKEGGDYEDKRIKVTFACITISGAVLAFLFARDAMPGNLLPLPTINLAGALIILVTGLLATLLTHA